MNIQARALEPEWLDTLPPEQPEAIHSRRDLKKVNHLMGHQRLMAELLRIANVQSAATRIIDLGAGDGSFTWDVMQRLKLQAEAPKVILVDRQRSFRESGRSHWRVEEVVADVFDYVAYMPFTAGTFIIANLFLHHFEAGQLRMLFEQVSTKADAFAACEPRRSRFALCSGKLLGLIGCNRVTRHDAEISIRAGFRDAEVSSLWPERSDWQLIERPGGLFSHCFLARRKATK